MQRLSIPTSANNKISSTSGKKSNSARQNKESNLPTSVEPVLPPISPKTAVRAGVN